MLHGKWAGASQSYSYIDSPNPNLICCICQTPFTEPTTSRTCSHTFCLDCITRALSASPHCPIDRSPLTLREMVPANQIVRYMVDELVVECVHRSAGCEFTCQRQLLHTHLKQSCLFVHVPCPEPGCDLQVLRKDIANHSSTCVHRLVKCEGCEVEVKLVDLEAHYLVCAAKTAVCTFCDDEYPRSQAGAHNASCQEMVIPCTHAKHGCPWSGPRRNLTDSHIPTCAYESIKGFLNVSDTRVSALTEENALLRQRLEASEGMIEVLKRELQAVESVLGPWYRPDSPAQHSARAHLQSPSASEGPAMSPRSPPSVPVTYLADIASYFPPSDAAASHEASTSSSVPAATRSSHPATSDLPSTLAALQTSMASLSTSQDSLGRMTELAIGSQAAEIGALRAVVNGLRMQVHAILMERGLGEPEEGAIGRFGMGMTGWGHPSRFFQPSVPGVAPHPAHMPPSSASVKL
ncbi:hypothetical protein BV25DRAFT_1892002 [Artomyces pyxidatus]|uniref:Uncharacterized protein n=1 Tax=Artomyces pyxidatus TaxID=48021 RepID=A0ACB8SQ92_9AGAM|nr:hypothetical protein BV25DRAFT_1892002 [Artomyces pyxidatus]